MRKSDKKSINERFLKLLEREMREGESQNDFAKRWGISSMAITYYKQGRIPCTESLILLQENLNISPDWLIFGLEPYKRFLSTE